MSYEIVGAVILGMFIHSALLVACEEMGYPVYTEKDRELVWKTVFGRGGDQ